MADPAPTTDPNDAPPAALRDTARALPKVLLHEHLDGGLRVHTLLGLLRARGLPAPADSVPALARWFDERAHAGSLVEYLRGFGLTVAAMGTPSALEQVAFEAAEDARAEGCVLAELRIAPLLFEPFGIDGDAAVAALLRGLSRSALPSGLIVCAMRHEDDARITQAAELALRWHRRAAGGDRPGGGCAGVVAFDLAGPEAGWPATRHAALLQRLLDGGLPLTLHAGEADAGIRVLEAARLGARRIGHGVRLVDLLDGPGAPALLAELHQRGTHLEVCPSSNVHTGAAASLATHPIHALWRAGVSLSVHTDNRLISRTDAATEVALMAQHGLPWADLLRMQQQALAASFLPEGFKAGAAAALQRHAGSPGFGG